MAQRTISTKFAIEGESEYRNSVKNINGELKLLSSEMAKTKSEFANSQNSMAALTAKADVLGKQYETQTQKVETMRSALDNARAAQQEWSEKATAAGNTVEELKNRMEALQQAEGDTAEEQAKLRAEIEKATEAQDAAQRGYDAATKGVNDWQLKLNYAETDLNKLNAEIERNEKLLQEARESADGCAKSIDEYGKATKEAGGESDIFGNLGSMAVEKISGALTAGGIAGTLSVIAEKVIEVAVEFDNARKVIVQYTGVSGDALEEFGQNVKNVTSEAVLDVGAVAATLGALNTRLGVTGDDLERYTGLFEKFSRATGEDAAQAVEYVSDLIYTYKMEVSDIPRILDMLTVAGQSSDANLSTLARTLNDSAVYAQQYGYTLEEMIALYAEFERVGERSTVTMGAMRKSYDDISETGLTFIQILHGIRDGTISADDAIEMFGQRNANLVSVVQNGTFNIEGMTEAIKNCEGATEATAKTAETYGDKWKAFWNSFWYGGITTGRESYAFVEANEAMEEATETADTHVKTIGELGNTLFEMMTGYDGTSESLQEFIYYMKTGEGQIYANADGYGELVNSLTDLKGELTALEAEYAAAMKESSSAVEQLTGRFNNLAEVTAMSVADMNAALDSQVAYMSTYSANMQTAAQKGVNEGLLKSLSDGSVESAEILAGIVTATDEEIAELNKKWEATQEGKDTFAETLAEMQTDFDAKSAELKTKYDEAVEHFNQYSEAEANGIQTVRGVIDGALAEAARLYSTYNQIGAGARSSFEAGFNGSASQLNPSAAERSAMVRMEKSTASLQAPAAPTVSVNVNGPDNRDVLLEIRDAVSAPPVFDRDSLADGLSDSIDRKLGTKKAIEERSSL